ncbi:glycosyltransferase family 2 protein [Sphingobium sp. Z007]|uniref:glycosyltransferase family 2 protein n=1 Tax=Sphingobium sp. Z007 TaxID=627495 RepID=UPI000B4976BA|nr:glycosyltransferase family 2 protein [Sphingobium sp. Z007]
MFADAAHSLSQLHRDARAIDVSIVMPCLDEAISLPHCIANARRALDLIEAQHGLFGEIVIADNGSTDGSQQLATSLGARIVPVARRGYGAALIGGCEGAYGRYLLMGDADGSYDFTDGVAMIGELLGGADLCMGSRFKGGIAPGAMPWKNRYIGNPVLTGILNLFFRSGISDAHCGLRAITRDCFASLGLSGSGMEFASEMVIKASLRRFRLAEVPATLSVDLRDRAPHLRPWRDGWRHLRYLMMLSPTWVFGVPGVAALGVGLAIFAMALIQALAPGSFPAVGNYWVVLAAALMSGGHLCGLLAFAGKLYGLRAGYRAARPWELWLGERLSLEAMLLSGLALGGTGVAALATVFWKWTARDFGATYSILPAVLGTTLVTIGMQTVMGGFLLAILGGNESRFYRMHARLPLR